MKSATSSSTLQLIECPRDAMQGWKTPIATETKISYLRALLTVGFHSIDCGSFVSPKAIPQMADTAEVVRAVAGEKSNSHLLVIVANTRGAEAAGLHGNISYFGFPFSVSPSFQQRNTNSGMQESFSRVKEIQKIAVNSGKELVVYLSMAFGNPYQDPYSEQMVYDWASRLFDEGIRTISLADTVGLASPDEVKRVTRFVVQQLPDAEIGVHLHSSGSGWRAKLAAAEEAGCRRFDGALGGFGGCPMADDELVGNIDSWNIIHYFEERGVNTGIDQKALERCRQMASSIFV